MSYVLQIKGFWQYVVKQNYDARYICHLEDRNCNWRQRAGESQTESRRSMQMCWIKTICRDFSYLQEYCYIFDYEVKDVFRHIAMNLRPQFGSLFNTVKEYR